MKTKPRKPDTTTAVKRLFDAVSDIVDGTRDVMVKMGDARHPQQITLVTPVLFQGTDMRCTIEAGPGIAARNAIEHAQMKASDQPVINNKAEVLREALTLLSYYAREIKETECTPNDGDCGTHWDDPHIEQFYQRLCKSVADMETLAREVAA